MELAHIRERLEKLRRRMRSVLGVGTATALSVAAAVLVVVAVLAFVSFLGGDGGTGMLLGGAFTLGVPLTAVAAVGVGKPWWRMSHEAAVLRQRERELRNERGDAIVAGEPITGDEYASMPAGRPASYRARRSARYDNWDEGSSVDSSGMTTIADDVPLPLAEYSALSAASHVIGRAVRTTMTTESLTTESPNEPVAREVGHVRDKYTVDAEPVTGPAADGGETSGGSSEHSQLVQATRPAQPSSVSLSPSPAPTWWAPHGRNRKAVPHPAAPDVNSGPAIGGVGLLVAAGALVALFAIGVIAGVLTSS